MWGGETPQDHGVSSSAMAILRAGTSGYSFKEWKGNFYPADLPEREMLAFYARELPAVEINYTFRHLPSPKTIEGWVAATPPEFSIVLKASQRITHILRLKNAGESARTFLDLASGLGPKLGPVLFQLPPSMRKDAARLTDFLTDLPPTGRYAFEFRDPSWFDDEITSILAAHRATLCVAESEDGAAPPLTVTAPFLYVRLRLESYSDEAIRDWGERLARLTSDGVDVYAFFKHEAEGPRYARALLSAAATAAGTGS